MTAASILAMIGTVLVIAWTIVGKATYKEAQNV